MKIRKKKTTFQGFSNVIQQHINALNLKRFENTGLCLFNRVLYFGIKYTVLWSEFDRGGIDLEVYASFMFPYPVSKILLSKILCLVLSFTYCSYPERADSILQ